MNLVSAAERLSAIDRSALVFNLQCCLHTQDQFCSCEACFEVCPTAAIQPGKPPAFDPEKCAGCLACIPHCPVGAYAADDAVRELLACVPRLEQPSIELICSLNPDGERGCSADSTAIQVRGCLAGLGTGALMTLAAMGLEAVYIRTDACANCRWGKVNPRLAEQIAAAKTLLSAWGKSDLLVTVARLDNPQTRPIWDAHNPPLSRRDLFRLASRQGQASLGRALEPAHAGGSQQAGRDRRRVIRAVEHLSAAQAAADPVLAQKEYAWLSISDSCTACGVCGRACPTGALSYTTDPEETAFRLAFTPQSCIACDRCAHGCAPDAIAIRPDPTFRQVFGSETAVVLREGALAHCEVCKTVYAAAPGVYVCPACNYRRKHPFGSRIPPAINKYPVAPSSKRQP